MNDEHESHRPEQDAARLGLVVVGEAAALHSGDESALDASEANIRETVDELIDEPFTERQEEVVQRLASVGGTIAAGLGGALAAQTGRSAEDVLGGAAGAIVWQERMAAQDSASQDSASHDSASQDSASQDSASHEPGERRPGGHEER